MYGLLDPGGELFVGQQAVGHHLRVSFREHLVLPLASIFPIEFVVSTSASVFAVPFRPAILFPSVDVRRSSDARTSGRRTPVHLAAQASHLLRLPIRHPRTGLPPPSRPAMASKGGAGALAADKCARNRRHQSVENILSIRRSDVGGEMAREVDPHNCTLLHSMDKQGGRHAERSRVGLAGVHARALHVIHA